MIKAKIRHLHICFDLFFLNDQSEITSLARHMNSNQALCLGENKPSSLTGGKFKIFNAANVIALHKNTAFLLGIKSTQSNSYIMSLTINDRHR